ICSVQWFYCLCLFFFFQAEDGIRDDLVTGVQTCALPISRERGYDPERIARMWVTLMSRLGYTRYAAHGSDWGNGIATRVALDDPTHVVALHIAGCGGAPAAPPATAGNQARQPAIPNSAVNAAHNLGYQEIQSTKPQTLGQGLSDSPVGLASWIIEKWYGWADHDGDLEKVFTKDELLTNI